MMLLLTMDCCVNCVEAKVEIAWILCYYDFLCLLREQQMITIGFARIYCHWQVPIVLKTVLTKHKSSIVIFVKRSLKLQKINVISG